MKFRAAIAIAISLALLGIFVLAVGWEEVFSAVGRASLSIYALAFVTSAFTLLARGYVWHLVLGVVDRRRPYWLVGSVFLTGMFAKYITPFGQVTSGVGVAAVVSRYYESAYEESLAGIVSADFLNYLPYYTFGGIGLGYLVLVESPSFEIRGYIVISVVGLALAATLIVLIWKHRRLVRELFFRFVGTIQRFLSRVMPQRAKALDRPNVEKRLQGFYLTFELLSRDRQTMLVAAALGHVAWLGLAGALYFSAFAVGVSLPIGIVFLCVALSKVGFLVPTPGGLGGVEIALAGALYLLTPMGGVLATAVAILYRFATYWFTVLLGGGTSIALTISDPTPP